MEDELETETVELEVVEGARFEDDVLLTLVRLVCEAYTNRAPARITMMTIAKTAT